MSTSKNLEPTNPSGRFTYSQELQGESIRLIKLTRDLESEHLCCSLVYKHLADKDLKYTALSYVWGDASDLVVLLCDGLPFKITRSLHQFLSQLRETMEEQYLWADAVCIDQANDAEKTIQVRLMTEIYSRAELVLIWLGEEQESDKDGLQLMLKVHDLLGWSLESDGRVYSDVQDLGLPDILDPRWDAVVNILTRQWFTRLWTVQESVVAHEAAFLCGQNEIQSSLILSVAALFNTDSDLKLVSGVRVGGIYASMYYDLRKLYSKNGHINLLYLLWLTRVLESTEPVDKIFALVGLTEDVENEFIDYERTLRDILIDLADRILTNDLAILIGSKPLCLLSYAEARPQSSDLPSWVPDWKARDVAFRPLSTIILPPNSSDDGNGYFSMTANKTLVVRGNRIDKLKVIFQSTRHFESAVGFTTDEMYTKFISLESWLNNIFQLVREHSCHSRYDNVAETFWRTLCFDGGIHEPASPDTAASFASWQQIISLLAQKARSSNFESNLISLRVFLSFMIKSAFLAFGSGYGLMEMLHHGRMNVYTTLAWLTSWIGIHWLVNQTINAAGALKPQIAVDPKNLVPHLTQLSKEAEPFERDFEAYAWGRRFCITEKGYMGWVCLAAREGDEVAALCGTRILFTFRQEDTGVRLIGDCYLQELMNGGWSPKEELRIL